MDARNKVLKDTATELQEGQLLERQPQDVIASLGRLFHKTGRVEDAWNNIAICSISCWNNQRRNFV